MAPNRVAMFEWLKTALVPRIINSDLHVLDIEHHEVESDAEDECDAKRLDDGGSRCFEYQ